MILLEIERLIIREFSINDASFYYNLVNDSDWLRFIGDRNVHSVPDAEVYLCDKVIPCYKKYGFGFYLVKTKEGNHSIGTTGLIDRDGIEHIEVGFAFLPEFGGKGFAFEATEALIKYASDKLKISPLVAITDIENIKSSVLLERLGLHFDKLIQFPNTTEQIKLYISRKSNS